VAKCRPVSETVSPLEAAIAALLASFQEIQLNGLRDAPDDEISIFHFCVGPQVREAFGLTSDSPLARWFRANGVNNPERMSLDLLLALRDECRARRGPRE